MGNKIFPPPVPPVPVTIWEKMGNEFFSLSTTSKVFFIGCFGYVIWRGFFGSCRRCDHNSKLLNAFREESRQSGLRIMIKRKDDYIFKVDNLKKVLAKLPVNSRDSSELELELREWRDYILTIDSQMEHFLDMHEEFLKYQNTSSVFVPHLTVIDEPYTGFLENLILRLLSQDNLENVFWTNISTRKKCLLNKLMDRLRAAYPDVTESKLRSSVAYAFNKQKRGVSAQGLTDIEIEVRTMLDKDAGSEEEVCCICLSEIDYDKAETNCKHSFHAKCIYSWIESEDTCPVCRKSPCYIQAIHSNSITRSLNQRLELSIIN